MRRHVLALMVAVNVALVLLLAALWVTPQGQLRNVAWQPPAPIEPEFAASFTANPEMNPGNFVATLDRPLFSPNRLPPPVKAAGAAPVPVDPLSNIRLYGIYAGPGTGGIIASVDGKSRRIHLDEKVGEWTVKSIKDRDVTFTRAGESRVVHLGQGVHQPGPVAAAGAPGGAVAAPAARQASQTRADLARSRFPSIEERRAQLRELKQGRAR
jgi:hypothetical protein